MQIVELDIKVPYEGRGKILGRLCERLRGKIRDIHFLPPTLNGISEIKMEIMEENVPSLLAELKAIIKNGRVTFKVLSEA